jgi:hypothetical protein
MRAKMLAMIGSMVNSRLSRVKDDRKKRGEERQAVREEI